MEVIVAFGVILMVLTLILGKLIGHYSLLQTFVLNPYSVLCLIFRVLLAMVYYVLKIPLSACREAIIERKVCYR